MVMRVEFYKVDGGRLCAWAATPPHRRSFQGTTMAAGRDLYSRCIALGEGEPLVLEWPVRELPASASALQRPAELRRARVRRRGA